MNNNNNNNNDDRRVVPTITLEEVMETFVGLDAVNVELAENAWNSSGRDDVTGVFVLSVNDDEGIDGRDQHPLRRKGRANQGVGDDSQDPP